MNDPYASEEETRALLREDTRSAAQRQLDTLLDEAGAWEQGAEPYKVLYGIAVVLLESRTTGTRLLEQCLDEMGYAGWNQPIKDNIGRWDVFSAVLNHLHPPVRSDDNDFPLGQACDLSDDGTCEACQ